MHFTYVLMKFFLMFLPCQLQAFGINFVVNFSHTRVFDFTITIAYCSQ